eukprot:8184306-Pyramimonas_sp.AAC.1
MTNLTPPFPALPPDPPARPPPKSWSILVNLGHSWSLLVTLGHSQGAVLKKYRSEKRRADSSWTNGMADLDALESTGRCGRPSPLVNTGPAVRGVPGA